ncbi:MAG: hypothetical protein HPY69_01195 [Armatimonadetes bacterium]|nr:hypothetical protein [Armatimonadota bacterium]
MARYNDEGGIIIVEDGTLRYGFTQVPNIVLRLQELSPGAKLAYAALLACAWKDGKFPGQEQVARDFGMGKRSLIRYLKELAEHGLIIVERPGRGMPNRYILPRLTPDADEKCQIGTSRSARLATAEVPDGQFPSSSSDESLVSHLDIDKDDSPSSTHIRLAGQIAQIFAVPKGQVKSIASFLRNYDTDVIKEAIQIVERRVEETEVRNPIAYLYTVIKIRQSDKDGAEVQRGQSKREQQASILAYARGVKREGWSLDQVAAILRDSYGFQNPAVEEAIKRLRQETAGG